MTERVQGGIIPAVEATITDGPPGKPGDSVPGTTGESVLDAKGLACPLPVLRLNRALRSIAPGAKLRLLATDRASVADVRAYCRETGHELTGFSEEAGGVYSFVIRRRRDAEPS